MFAFIIYILIVFLGFIFTKNKVVNCAQCLLVVLLFGFSQDYNDFFVYERIYESIQQGFQIDYEIGYTWLNHAVACFGASYIQYRVIVGLLFCMVMFPIVRKMSLRPNFVWSLYLLYSAMFDACILRNSLAMSLTMAGFFFFFKAESDRRISMSLDVFGGGRYLGLVFLSTIFFVLAACMHSAFWLFLLFIPLWFLINSKNGIKKVVVVTLILYLVFASTNNAIFSLYSKLLIREATTDKYMTNMYSNFFGVVYDIFKYLFLMLPVLFYSEKKIIYSNLCAKTLVQKKSIPIFDFLNANILKLDVLFCIVLVPQYFAVNFSRLFRLLIIFNYIFLSNRITDSKMKSYTLGITYSVILASLVFFFESANTLDDILFMHFETNSFLNFFNW